MRWQSLITCQSTTGLAKFLRKVVAHGEGKTDNLVAQGHFSLIYMKLEQTA